MLLILIWQTKILMECVLVISNFHFKYIFMVIPAVTRQILAQLITKMCIGEDKCRHFHCFPYDQIIYMKIVPNPHQTRPHNTVCPWTLHYQEYGWRAKHDQCNDNNTNMRNWKQYAIALHYSEINTWFGTIPGTFCMQLLWYVSVFADTCQTQIIHH